MNLDELVNDLTKYISNYNFIKFITSHHIWDDNIPNKNNWAGLINELRNAISNLWFHDFLIKILSFDRDKKPFAYHGVFLKEFNLKLNQWQQVILAAELPVDFVKDETFAAYFWNPEHNIFYVDDLEVEIHLSDDPYKQLFEWKRDLF